MRGIINYYSTTGNTKRMVDYFTYQVPLVSFTILDMKKMILPDFSKYEIIGFAFPVEFLGIPRFVLNWIRHIPKQLVERNVFLLLSFSTISGTVLIQARNELKPKFFKIIAGHSLHMPENYPITRVRGFTSNLAPNVAEKGRFRYFISIFNELMESIEQGHEILEAAFRLSLVNYFMNMPDPSAAKRSMGFKYLEKSKCTKCGVCSLICPTKAISLQPYPEFEEIKCVGCWGCFHHCPTHAIYTNKVKNKGHYLAEKMPALLEKLPLKKDTL
ncbi:EFR1 family ferrodoxin [bacterium]|nr:EFR1 family ferrodoxin [bacterium]